MGAATHLSSPHVEVRLSVGALSGRADLVPSGELLRIFQRHPAGRHRAPVVVIAGTTRAVRPAILVHRQGVVRFGSLVFRTSAIEVDAIVHQTD